MKRIRSELCPGVGLTYLCENRFKSDFLSVSFVMPFRCEENPVSNIITSQLMRGCEKYPSTRLLEKALEENYDAEVYSETYQLGNSRVITFCGDWISDRFSGEALSHNIMSILSEIMIKPLCDSDGCLSSEFLRLEKKALIQTVRTEINDKRRYAISKCRSELLKNDAYGAPKYGSEKEIEVLSCECVVEFYKKMISSCAVEFFYSGALSQNNLMQMISSVFSPLINNKLYTSDLFEAYVPFTPSDFTKSEEESDSEQSTLTMGFFLDSNDENRYALRLFSEILSSSPASRLFMNVREKYGICYDCFMSPIYSKSAAIIAAGIEYKRADEAKEAILGEIKSIAESGVTPDELEFAKETLSSAYLSIEDNRRATASWELSALFRKSYESPAEATKLIEKIDCEQIKKAAAGMRLCNIYLLSGKKEQQ